MLATSTANPTPPSLTRPGPLRRATPGPRRVGVRRLLVAVVTACSLVSTACGAGGGDSSAATPEITDPAGDAAPARTYVGTVEGTDALVAVVVDGGGGAVVYLCDGEAGLAEWFDTDRVESSGDLVAASGTHLTLAAVGGGPDGAISVVRGVFTDADGARHAFRAEPVDGGAGLFMPPPPVDEGEGRVGWIVAGDGTVRGAVRRGRSVEPAPTFAPTVRLGGQVTSLVRVGRRPPVDAPVVAAPAPRLRAVFDWAMPDRWAASWNAWGFAFADGGVEPLIGYDPAFVHPASWHPTFDACDSGGGGSTVVRFDWRVERDGVAVDTASTDRCDLPNDPGDGPRERLDFPDQGTYTVTLTVTDEAGGTASVTHEVKVRDLLIVSMGDSSASGEGNPDHGAPLGLGYLYPRCHRSRTSGHSLAARAIERADPHVSVTFLSYACSGATVSTGILGPYDGIFPYKGVRWSGPVAVLPVEGIPFADALPPQVEQALWGSCFRSPPDCDAGPRRVIDRLFIAIGVNDIGFADVITECAKPESGCENDRDLQERIDRGLAALRDEDGRPDTSIADIARRIREVDLPVDRVFLTSYPDNPFGDARGRPAEGCGVLFLVTKKASRWIRAQGRELNGTLQRLAVEHDFGFVDGIADEFASHGYCAPDTWFRSLSESLLDQTGIEGVLHPIPEGHEAIARHLVEAVDSFVPFTPVLDARVTVEQIRVTEAESPVNDGRSRLGRMLATTGSRQVTLRSQVFATRRGVNVDGQQLDYSNSFTLGKWVTIPDGDLAFDIVLGAGDELDIVFGLPSGGLVIRDHRVLSPVFGDQTVEVSQVRERDGLRIEIRFRIQTAPRQVVAP